VKNFSELPKNYFTAGHACLRN